MLKNSPRNFGKIENPNVWLHEMISTSSDFVRSDHSWSQNKSLQFGFLVNWSLSMSSQFLEWKSTQETSLPTSKKFSCKGLKLVQNAFSQQHTKTQRHLFESSGWLLRSETYLVVVSNSSYQSFVVVFCSVFFETEFPKIMSPEHKF